MLHQSVGPIESYDCLCVIIQSFDFQFILRTILFMYLQGEVHRLQFKECPAQALFQPNTGNSSHFIPPENARKPLLFQGF